MSRAVAAAVGKAVGALISVASAGIGAMMHESERPAMVDQLRVILNVALNEEWQALMQNPSIGVMAGVNYLSEQIEGSLVLSSGVFAIDGGWADTPQAKTVAAALVDAWNRTLPKLPAVFGLDPAGVVEAVGPTVQILKTGDHVLVPFNTF